MVKLTISSKSLTDQLRKLGLMEKKARKIRFPFDLIPETLYRHFLRGYFDGDGGVSVVGGEKFKCIRVSIASNPLFCREVESFLHYKKIETTKIQLSKLCDSAFISIGSYFNIKRFKNFIYKDSSIFLDRKCNIFTNFFETHQGSLKFNNERRGLCYAPSANRWQAYFKGKYLGRFKEKDDGINAINIAEEDFLNSNLF